MPAPEGTRAEALTGAAKDGIADIVTGYVSKGLRDFEFASTNLPGFLADTGPVVAAAQPTRQIVRAACRSYARGGGPQNLPGFDAAWGGICGPYLDSLGETPNPGSLARPFQGGQCPVAYSGIYSFRSVNTDGSLTAPTEQGFSGLVGPIRSIVRRGTPGAYQAFLLHGEGLESFLRSSSAPQGGLEDLRIVSVSRDDGGADSCGGPPVVYAPPTVRPGLPGLPPTTPIDIPGIGPTPITITFDPDGNINVGLPDIGIEVPISDPFGLGGEDDGDGGGDPGNPTSPGSAGSSSDTGSGGAAEGEAPPGSELVGLLVAVVEAPPNANTFDNNAATVYRGFGYVRMGYPSRLGLDITGGTVISPQFFHAQQRGLTSWAVRANIGFNLRTTPYYRNIEE